MAYDILVMCLPFQKGVTDALVDDFKRFFAYDPSVSQGHTGILTPITSAPAPIATTDAENTKLKAGEVVLRSGLQTIQEKVVEWLYNTSTLQNLLCGTLF